MSGEVITPTPGRDGERTSNKGPYALIGVLLVIAALFVAITTDGTVLRLFAAVAVVVVPGLCVISLLRLRPRDRAEVIALAIGLGVTALIVGGLLVDRLTSLSPGGWLGYLVLLVGAALLVGGSPGNNLETTPVDDLDAHTDGDVGVDAVAAKQPTHAELNDTAPAAQRSQGTLRVAVTAALCVVALGIALSIAVDSAREQSGQGFTALSFDVVDEGSDERLTSIGVVIENRERVASTYRLVVTAGDRTLVDQAGIRLAADSSTRFDVPVADVASGTQVRAAISRDGGTEAYRSVTFTLP